MFGVGGLLYRRPKRQLHSRFPQHTTRMPCCIVPTTHKIAMGLVTESKVPCPETLMAIIIAPCTRTRSRGRKREGVFRSAAGINEAWCRTR